MAYYDEEIFYDDDDYYDGLLQIEAKMSDTDFWSTYLQVYTNFKQVSYRHWRNHYSRCYVSDSVKVTSVTQYLCIYLNYNIFFST